MTSALKAIPLAVLAAVTTGGDATAQMVCGQRSAVIAELEGRYGETRRSIAMQQGRGIVEVFASEATGSWTILLTNMAGRACLVAAGDAFDALPVFTGGTPA